MEERQPRKLAVILHADVAGSTALAQRDEALAHARIQDAFRRFSSIITDYNGTTHEIRGDALVAEFARASDAVAAALSFQADNVECNAKLGDDLKPRVRIGIGLGEVVIADNTVTGAGVVLAQRVEQLAEADGLCITGAIYEAVPQHLPFDYADPGKQQVKGFDEPIHVYHVRLKAGEKVPSPERVVFVRKAARRRKRYFTASAVALIIVVAAALVWWQPWRPEFEPASVDQMAFELPDNPSIAVLPFTNMSGDPEQEYFADGMTDDLITDLSKISGLVVIARNSTFAYKGKSPDVRKVASDLNVRYVLEGSVRRAADQVRINAQLIDGESGHHLWADRYDGAISDIFTLQDRMTRKIVSALAVELTPEEQAQTATRETENIAAYDAFLQGWGHYNRQTSKEFAKAIKFFERAIELDPDYAAASAALALSYWMGSEFGGLSKILGVSWREIRHRSRKYIDLAMKNPTAVSYIVASPAALKQRRYEDAIDYAQRAVQLDPNNAEAHRALAYALFYANRAEEAIGSANRAMRLDPSNRAIPLQYIGRAHFALGNYEKAVEFIERARDINPKVTPHSAMLAAALVHLGRDEEAKSTLAKYNATWGYIPSVREVMYFWPFKDPDVARRFAEGLVKAGLPPPPSGYYVLSEEERLESDEIRALVFGRDVTGFDPWSGEQWWIKRDADGQFSWRGTAEKSWSGPSVDADRGKSWIEGNLLCERWEVQDFQICIPLFRNPNGTKEGKDEYVSMYDTGIYPWSTVE